MGGGDLNAKKSWHPQKAVNIAATSKAEVEAIQERKKLQQRLDEIKEERRKEEIQSALEAAGGQKRVDRVEWMYQGPSGGEAGDAGREAYLLGTRRIDALLKDNEANKQLAKHGGLEEKPSAVASAVNVRDTAAKIREDPMLAIKKQEQDAYSAIMNDPYKRKQLLASMGMEEAKTKDRAERRHKHRHRHRRHHDDSYERRHRRRSESRDWSRDRSGDRSGDRSRSPRRYECEEEDGRRQSNRHRRRRRSEWGDGTEGRRRDDDRDYEAEYTRETKGNGGRSRDRPASTSAVKSTEGFREGGSRRGHEEGTQSGQGRDGRKVWGRGCRQPEAGDKDQANERRRASAGEKSGSRDARTIRRQDGDERALKLAAMQKAATDLDQDRERRLAMTAAAERAEREADDKARQGNKQLGGDARFVSTLHSRAADLKMAGRG